MATPSEPRSNLKTSDPMGDREQIVYAHHQWFTLALYGGLCCISAVIFSWWNPTDTQSRWFWVVVGPLAGTLVIVRAQSIFGDEGVDRDPGPYIGIFIGTTVGSMVIALFSLESWVLPGVFLVVAIALAFMAWVEQSGIGMTSSLTVAVLGAGTAVADLEQDMVGLSLVLGLMLLSGAAALVVGGGDDGPAERASSPAAPKPVST